MTTKRRPHVITLTRTPSWATPDGGWWYSRQAGNYHVVEQSEQGFSRRRYALRRAKSHVPADVRRRRGGPGIVVRVE